MNNPKTTTIVFIDYSSISERDAVYKPEAPWFAYMFSSFSDVERFYSSADQRMSKVKAIYCDI